jgi:hypothetical protein
MAYRGWSYGHGYQGLGRRARRRQRQVHSRPRNIAAVRGGDGSDGGRAPLRREQRKNWLANYPQGCPLIIGGSKASTRSRMSQCNEIGIPPEESGSRNVAWPAVFTGIVDGNAVLRARSENAAATRRGRRSRRNPPHSLRLQGKGHADLRI